jgi:hypothetical protein
MEIVVEIFQKDIGRDGELLRSIARYRHKK